MRVLATLLIVSLAGCSFLMASKRLREPPAEGQPPRCDTNAVIPLVDLLVGVTAAAIGFGAMFGDGGASRRAELTLVGLTGATYIAGWWFGRRWHRECQDAKQSYARHP